ncbi:MAG: NHL repeat-containing protein [Candidatus Cybelea sp.]
MNLCLSRVVVKLTLLCTAFALTGCAGGSSTTTTTPPAAKAKHATSACPCLYVANPGSSSVAVFGTGSTGNVAPIQMISGSNTGLNLSAGVAVDASGNMYVANQTGGPSRHGSVTVYAAGSTGNVTPIQTISGSKTALASPLGIALDPANGDIYVANASGDSVTIYAPGANGNIAPIGTIAGANTELNGPDGLASDENGNIYVSNFGGGSNDKGSVTVFTAGSVGNVKPRQTISDPAKHYLSWPFQIALDTSLNIYVANWGSNRGGGHVTVYGAGANGMPTPIRTIGGSKTNIFNAAGVALDGDNDIYVANGTSGPSGYGSVTVYAPGKKHNVAPINTIAGSNTGLDRPAAIVIH